MSTMDAWVRDDRDRDREAAQEAAVPDPLRGPPATSAEIALLQRSAGNRAVAQLLAGTRPGAALVQRENGDDEEEGEPRQQQLQLLVPREAQASAPEATVSFKGAPALTDKPDRVIAASSMIDMLARWTPGPTPPNGHSPDANVGWIQNINFCNEQADYFADGQYVESSWVEYMGDMVDSDHAEVWYDPPRAYADVAEGARAALLGDRPRGGPVATALVDKPQTPFMKRSPGGGRLYRFGGVIEFSAYLVIAERDWSRGTVLETIRWKFEFAYSLPEPPQRDGPDGAFEEQYADAYVVSQSPGVSGRTPNMEKGGLRGNVFFNDTPPSWVQLNAARDPRGNRFPSLI